MTIAGVGHWAGFSFMFGTDRELNAEAMMIERPNFDSLASVAEVPLI
jgi:hypothetical protein